MPALNFTPHNAALVIMGRKPHTIRQQRKRPFQVGDRLIHYRGQRTADCVCLGESIAAVVLPCCILPTDKTVRLGNRLLPSHQVLALGQSDGFDSIEKFFKFFKGGLLGQLIGWDSITTPGGLVYPTQLQTLDYLKESGLCQ